MNCAALTAPEPFSDPPSSRGARDLNATAGALGENGAGVMANLSNMGTRNALVAGQDQREGFYSATQLVDFAMENSPAQKAALSVKNYRNDLINFLTDGYLT